MPLSQLNQTRSVWRHLPRSQASSAVSTVSSSSSPLASSPTEVGCVTMKGPESPRKGVCIYVSDRQKLLRCA